MIQYLITGYIAIVVTIVSIFGIQIIREEPKEDNSYKEEIQQLIAEYVNASLEDNQIFGANLPIAGSTYNLAGSGVSGSATSITLKTLTLVQTGQKLIDSDFSDLFFITLEPGNKRKQEIVACTTVTQNSGGDATLSGCSRGMSPITPYTASTTLQFTHGGGTQVIFSDPPQLFREFAAKGNTETITGLWSFDVHPEATSTLGVPTTSNQYATVLFAQNLTNQGAATSGPTISGISEQATQIEMASSTPFDIENPHYISSEFATSTPSAVTPSLFVVVTKNNGKINQLFLDLTESYSWTGSQTFTNATITNNLIVGTSVFDTTPTSTGLTIIGDFFLDGNATTTGNLFTFDNANTIFNTTSTYNGVLAGSPTTTENYSFNLLSSIVKNVNWCRYDFNVIATGFTPGNDNFSMTASAQNADDEFNVCEVDTTKDWTFTTVMRIDQGTAGEVALSWGIGQPNFENNSMDIVVDHAMFIAYGIGVEASVADGTTQATSTILSGGFTLTNINRYTIERRGAEINFYINGQLLHTATSNLPDKTDDVVEFRLRPFGASPGSSSMVSSEDAWPMDFVGQTSNAYGIKN